ncbi:hypothetical protein AAG747_07635 [Rapidithrix thailandica]|uniref:DUF4625 domain-containing protein n=1 Tax=Rapidithrix thailandica TaxID=413964 RepID=A0AAW9S5Y3_9BACT
MKSLLFFILSFSIVMTGCNYNDDEAPVVKNLKINGQEQGLIKLILPDSLIIQAEFSDNSSLGSYRIHIMPDPADQFEIPFGNPSLYRLDTLINIGGQKVIAQRIFYPSVSNAANGTYSLSMEFEDFNGTPGQSHQFDLTIENPGPRIEMFQPHSDSANASLNTPVIFSGKTYSPKHLIDSLQLTLTDITSKSDGGINLGAVVLDTMYRNLSESIFEFTEAYQPDSIGTYQLELKSFDNQKLTSIFQSHILISE